MKISYNWLKQFITLDWEAEKTGELLTDLGLEIEGITSYQSVQGGLDGVVVGEVLTCRQHPNADRLKLTTVAIGQEETLQIVCGAPNVAAGQKVPVATVGTTLYTAEGEAWKIKKGKIRGEESHGMICAEDELGLGSSHDGIMILDENLEPGTPAASIFDIENDSIFEIGLTPNRADAMSHLGTARDLKAALLRQEINSSLITPSNSVFKVDSRMAKVDIEVLENERCPRYAGVTISGLKVANSPNWLQNRLKAIGLSPINNVVDVTNYVLHELGQPLHAFDLAKISEGKIVVKTCEPGTKFTTLDEVERELHEDDLMICDAQKPLCIAGVLGGINSGVTENTSAIFLESAYFNPVSVRKTAKRHGLNTDASFRFERGIDPNITEYALKRAALLIQEIAGGEVTSDIVDIYPKKIEDHQVFLNFDKVSCLIGEELPRETIKSILTSLEIKINNVTESGIGMTIPAFRNDVTREVDVIEEILRVYGYNNVNFGNKLNATIANVSKYEDHYIQNRVAQQLVAQGFYEIMTNSLTSELYSQDFEYLQEAHNVTLFNPLSTDLNVLRQTMIASGLEAIKHNQNHKRFDLKFFEFGKTYHQYNDKERKENKHLGVFVTGKLEAENWIDTQSYSNFFYMKGIVDSILDLLGMQQVQTNCTREKCFSEGLDLSLGKNRLVSYGLLKTKVTKTLEIDSPVYYANFYWDIILKLLSKKAIKYTEIPKYPSVRRDFALLLDNTIAFDDLAKVARQTEKHLLKEVDLFDVYQGKLPKGKKSYALKFIFQDDKKTLTDKQVDKVMQKLQQRFEKEFGANLR